MKDENGKPALGETATSLGVRVPKDITPDEDGIVHLGPHGMSVAPSLETLPFMLIPRRLKHCVAGAIGSDNARIWKMGKGPWASESVAPDLRLELDPEKPETHGLVSPDLSMPLPAYRAALATTQDSWFLVEEPQAT
jgi:hypothetical protein